MNHKNELIELLDSIITCRESMAKVGKLLKEVLPETPDAIPQNPKDEAASKTKSTPAKLPEQAKTPAATVYTFTEVRKAFSAKSHAGFTDQIRELISKYGADRLSGVKEEDYPALMADLEVIG